MLRAIAMFIMAAHGMAFVLVPLMALLLSYLEIWPERALGAVFGDPSRLYEYDPDDPTSSQCRLSELHLGGRGHALTSGVANTAVGRFSLSSATTGSFSTGVAGALDLNNGNENTTARTGALLLNTTGANNTANGTFTLIFNDSGSDNTAVGSPALRNNTTGNANTAIGRDALFDHSTGNFNMATAHGALVNSP